MTFRLGIARIKVALGKCVAKLTGGELSYGGRPKQISGLPSSDGTLTPPPKFVDNILSWRIDRSKNTFRVYVVEPRKYSPRDHAAIFDAALTRLISPSVERINPYQPERPPSVSDPFDLVTFPEAFLPANHLVEVIRASHFPFLGCVHVGLRPSGSEDQHLFSIVQLRALLDALLELPAVEGGDLKRFSEWLEMQSVDHMFNVGCLFALDADQKIRVCLHPKSVRSKYEFSLDPTKHMAEANLLSLVTLLPTDRACLSITLQPLLCSDVLKLPTDKPNAGPIDAVNMEANALKCNLPDHVDIVSVATHTPQPEQSYGNGTIRRTWHQQYRDSFKRTISDPALARHRFTSFVLSNFQELGEGENAGLSGIFVPMRSRGNHSAVTYTSVFAWGRKQDNDDNAWELLTEESERGFKSLGYLVTLTPSVRNDAADARMMGFVITPLPRHGSLALPTTKLADFRLLTTVRHNGSQKLEFQ